MTSRQVALNFEAYLRRHGRLTHDEELDLMQQGIPLHEHYGLQPEQYLLPPQHFMPCRFIENYDLTVQYGAHSLSSAQHALLTQRAVTGMLPPNAVPTGGYRELQTRPRADSAVASVSRDSKPRVEERSEPASESITRSIELDEAIKNDVPLKRRRKSVELDEDFEDEIPLKRRRKDPAQSTTPKLKVKFKAPPPPPRAQATPAQLITSTPRKRTSTRPKNGDDSDEDYQPPTRSTATTPLPNIYTNASLPYTTSTAPTTAATPTRTPSITSSGRSISPATPRNAPVGTVFKNGTRPIPAEIQNIMAAVREIKIGKDGLPQRTGLRNTLGFTGRDGVLKATSVLWPWYGDTRVFSEQEWKFFASNEEGRRKRNGGR
ncbi:uncharacterized protein CLAFUR5_12933 [Fulvia fulva]|uniref:Uncharacterized protein n=1 Tax=Passalora fulva TaxID=5499 RepID=A0A9Q8PK27_PASFU|nr:uncharacterized protein CLAFUR5_12933 [Fulvia fulva]KAK4612727.1 hypothetical protein CLAFUR0_13083 [Fulvia fulva]UJO23824.1 hypothetical protein CLAFUR5_12933 [Fulvia fulva]WPV36498.1 hypothetical protein CLAFUW7_13082 [Fulvia fulva]